MKIRSECADDADAITALTYRAFKNHPHHEPGAEPTEHQIVNALRDANALSLSLVAEDTSGIVGQITFSPVSINGEDVNWFGLGPVSVIPSKQNQGIGAALIKHGIAKMQANGAKGLVLLGEPEYYARFGFEVVPGLTLPGVPAEYFMALKLDSNSTIPQGDVAYHTAFG